MRVEWHGQAAFSLRAEQGSVFIDPFGDVSGLRAQGIAFDYPPIEVEEVDLLLVTHEHRDHNGVEAIAGEPAEPVDEFLDLVGRVERRGASSFETADLPTDDAPIAVVPATP